MTTKKIPTWVGKPKHTWKPQLGGGVWYQGKSTLKAVREVFKEYSRPVLIGLRSDAKQEGYRFDLNTWSPNAPTYNYWEDRCSTESVLKILEGYNCEFIWSMPTPDHCNSIPYAGSKGPGYPWQTPEYYAAYLQYLTELPSMKEGGYRKLDENVPFFRDVNCTEIDKLSEKLVGGNWANLRARRGHPKPFKIQAVILGIEPYGDAQEAFIDDGARYGKIVMRFRNAIRFRGMLKMPLGLNIVGNYPMSDFGRPWFKPLFDELRSSDFSYLDMHHHYFFGEPKDEINRIFPTIVNDSKVDGFSVKSNGWQNSWVPKSDWLADYSKYLWMWDDIRLAIEKIGDDPARWKLGCAEHGLAITSGFKGNDMGAGIHWALWLAECMRCNATWDMNWNLMETGFSHAQIHFRDGHLTRTPGHYVYKMAQRFYGFKLLDNSYKSPTVATGIEPYSKTPYISQDVVMRVFHDPVMDSYNLFVINKDTSVTAIVNGWERWTVNSWKQLKSGSFTDQNPIGNHNPNDLWHPETVKTVNVSHVKGKPLLIPPISVNHIKIYP